MTERRFFCHRTACEMSEAACLKRQRANRTPTATKYYTSYKFEICRDCPQGAAILSGPKRGVVEVDLSGESRQRLLKALSEEAMENGRQLGEHCALILAAHALNFRPEYKGKLNKIKERGEEAVDFFPFAWF